MWYKCIWFIIVISTSSCSLRESLGESPINHHSSIIQAIEDTRHIKPLLMIIMAIHNLKLAHKLQINCHPINHSSVSLFRSLNAVAHNHLYASRFYRVPSHYVISLHVFVCTLCTHRSFCSISFHLCRLEFFFCCLLDVLGIGFSFIRWCTGTCCLTTTKKILCWNRR